MIGHNPGMTLLRTMTGLLGGVLAASVLVACTSDDPDEPQSVGGTQEVAATPSSTAIPATATSTPIPGLTPAAGATPANLVLDAAPRATPVVTQKQLAPFTPSTLALPDRMDTVLYDVAANTATNFGPGTQGQFSPDGKKMVYSTQALNNPTEVYLYDVATRERRALALGRDPRFMGNDRVVFVTGASARTVIDLKTFQQAPLPVGTVFPDFTVTELNGGTYQVRTLSPNPLAFSDRLSFAVEEVATSRVVLQLEAARVAAAGVDELLVAAPVQSGMTNLFIIDVKTGAQTYISTARWQPANWPLVATADLVAWTEAYCDFANPGKTRIYDRRTKTITELDRTFWVTLAPDGKLGVGEFGAKSLIDLATLRATFVLPGTELYDRGRDASWSRDYKFASTGFTGGHGGNCG